MIDHGDTEGTEKKRGELNRKGRNGDAKTARGMRTPLRPLRFGYNVGWVLLDFTFFFPHAVILKELS
jgi:hypothetical protein